ncbi:MAG: hypothetical protein CSA66_01025 [Proteobacteria bacterium]|nr:MAG: hypothetical protein CSA66_01025 [Pseudomonadota bacterium]
MGLFGFGKKSDKSGAPTGKVGRLDKKLMNKWGQTAERQRAMQMLADIGSEEALSTLLKRFTYRTDGDISDQDEKRLGYELLLAAGERALGPIEAFITKSDGVFWPLKALKEIAGMDTAVELMLRALDRVEGIVGRRNEQKVQLVSNLRDFPHPLVLERLKGLCSDPDHEVRVMAVDGLMTYGAKEALPVIAERLLDPEESQAVHAVIFEQLVDLGWSLEPWREALDEADVLPSHYRFTPKGRVTRAG